MCPRLQLSIKCKLSIYGEDTLALESRAAEGMPSGMVPRASLVTARQALPSGLVFCRTGTQGQECLKNCRRGEGEGIWAQDRGEGEWIWAQDSGEGERVWAQDSGACACRCQNKIQCFLCCYILDKKDSSEDKIKWNDRQKPWVNQISILWVYIFTHILPCSPQSLQNKIQKGFTFKTHIIRFRNTESLPKWSNGHVCCFGTLILLMGKYWQWREATFNFF